MLILLARFRIMGHGWSGLALLIVMVILALITKGIDAFLLHEVFQFLLLF
jgi:hypothetical protein